MESTLTCPNCGGSYLHHHAVEVFLREGEDGPQSHVMALGFDRKHISNHDRRPRVTCASKAPSYAPVTRRDGLLIRFWCENCDADPAMTLVQHKGQTLVEWLCR